MAFTIKQLLKPVLTTLIASNSGLTQRSITYQNLISMDITNYAKQVDFASDNYSKRDQYYYHDF